MNIYDRALELRAETVAHRRWLHSHAEVGLHLPNTVTYISEQLTAMGIDSRPCGAGITALIGTEGPCLLLRADMDALPMAEASGEAFACPTGRQAHTCGHDLHAAMLLTAARLLKEREAELCGSVKLMFQPAEETFEGARDMLQAGILTDPPVDAAMALHVAPGHTPVGLCMHNSSGVMMNSVDGFRIEISGRGGHGAYPNLSVDPINIAVQLHLALQALIAREADPERTCVLTVGQLHGGTAANIIPDTAVMEGTLRTDDEAVRARLVDRIRELVAGIPPLYGGSAALTRLSGIPSLRCDPVMTEQVMGWLAEAGLPGLIPAPGMHSNASEDFACIAELVPSVFLYLSAGYPDERGDWAAHNPKVRFNEDVLPWGAAALAHCAVRWLQSR